MELVSQVVGESFVTPNGDWLHFKNAVTVFEGAGTIDDVAYTATGSGTGHGKASLPDFTDGRSHVPDAVAVLDPVGGGDRIVCEGFFQIDKISEPEPLGEEGLFRFACDNGTKSKGDITGQYELDPATGQPVWIYYYDGEIR
jgi:hypothetical protein